MSSRKFKGKKLTGADFQSIVSFGEKEREKREYEANLFGGEILGSPSGGGGLRTGSSIYSHRISKAEQAKHDKIEQRGMAVARRLAAAGTVKTALKKVEEDDKKAKEEQEKRRQWEKDAMAHFHSREAHEQRRAADLFWAPFLPGKAPNPKKLAKQRKELEYQEMLEAKRRQYERETGKTSEDVKKTWKTRLTEAEVLKESRDQYHQPGDLDYQFHRPEHMSTEDWVEQDYELINSLPDAYLFAYLFWSKTRLYQQALKFISFRPMNKVFRIGFIARWRALGYKTVAEIKQAEHEFFAESFRLEEKDGAAQEYRQGRLKKEVQAIEAFCKQLKEDASQPPTPKTVKEAIDSAFRRLETTYDSPLIKEEIAIFKRMAANILCGSDTVSQVSLGMFVNAVMAGVESRNVLQHLQVNTRIATASLLMLLITMELSATNLIEPETEETVKD